MSRPQRAPSRGRNRRGFTLLEVVIALAILAVSLTMLLTTNAASLNNASRSRDITVATLLARSKMIDMEQKLADEGFTEGDQEEDGDFKEEGRPEIKWSATIKQIEITLDSLTDLCEGFTGGGEDDGGSDAGGCGAMLGGVGLPLEGITSDLSNSLRVITLKVTWPVGNKYTESMSVTGLVTREDLALQQAQDLLDAAQRAQQQGRQLTR